MKYFLDTEFNEDGKTIDLISIGIVAEDGREFYAVNADCDFDRIWTLDSCDWLRDNVMPQLPQNPRRLDSSPECQTRRGIANGIIEFVDDQPEFWGYYADYDWIAFCQLFGRMIDLPKHFPKYCRDIKQLADSLGNPQLPQQLNEHHALDDARWNKQAYEFLIQSTRSQFS